MCTTNEDCRTGQCCQNNQSSVYYQVCRTSPWTCYTADGTSDNGDSCSHNSNCATQCCDATRQDCTGYRSSASHIPCMVDPYPWVVVGVGIAFSLATIISVVIFIICVVCKKKQDKDNEFKHSGDDIDFSKVQISVVPRHATQDTPKRDPNLQQGYPAAQGNYAQIPGQAANQGLQQSKPHSQWHQNPQNQQNLTYKPQAVVPLPQYQALNESSVPAESRLQAVSQDGVNQAHQAGQI